jgi:Arabinose efflux permease
MIRHIPRNVWVAGWVSFFMDVSSEMVYPLIPLFLSSTLGVSKSTVGLIEGLAEATASVLKLFSGAVSDRFGKNKLLMGLGYGISTASRPLLAMAGSWGMVLTSRMADRVGKGIRTAPRDAIIALSTSSDRLGSAFGFHRAMDTAGAVAGPALALLLLAIWPSDYRTVFWFSILPGIIAVLLIVFFISADGRAPITRAPFTLSLHGFDAGFVTFMVVIGLFSLGNSSNVFLILKAEQVGMSGGSISAAYLAFNAVYAVMSMPAGIVADRLGRRRIITVGFGIFACAYAGVALATVPWHMAGLFVLYGVYMGLTDGVQRAYLATLIPDHRKATGFGLYHMVVGLAILPASVVAGVLWDHIGPSAPFWFGAAMSTLAMAIFIYSGWGVQAKREP